MKKSNLVAGQNKYLNNGSKNKATISDKTFVNCVIADETPRKLDFLILVIETLQINATDSLLLKAKDIGLPDDFSSRVQFWKISYFINIFFQGFHSLQTLVCDFIKITIKLVNVPTPVII